MNLNLVSMDAKSIFLSLMLLSAFAGCNREVESDSAIGQVTGEGRTEIQFVFGGSKESENYTRAIATDAENQIDNLDIYVFSAEQALGTYTFQEKWSNAAVDNKQTKSFALQGAGTSRKASVFPDEVGAKIYLKFFCVANCTSLYTQGTGLAPAFTAGGTSEADFRGYTTPSLTTTSLLKPALVMVGETAPIQINGSILSIEMNLNRLVTRFDFDNTATKSGMTITKISLEKGRPWAKLFTPTEAAGGMLMTYAGIDYTALSNANKGLTESAFYTYPVLKADDANLMIEGSFYNKDENKTVTVGYPVKFAQTADGVTTMLDITANHRYTLHISDAMESSVTAYFEIKDWTTGGGIQVKPTNEAPVIDSLVAITDDQLAVWDTTKQIFTLPMDAGSFSLFASASAGVTAQPVGNTGDWFTLAHEKDTVIDGRNSSKFTVTYQAITKRVQKQFVLYNAAAANDVSLQTFITVVPFPQPIITPIPGPGCMATAPHTVDGVTGAITFFKHTLTGGVTLQIDADGGTRLGTLPAWLKADKTSLAADGSYTFMLDEVEADKIKDTEVSSFKIDNVTTPGNELTIPVTLDVTPKL